MSKNSAKWRKVANARHGFTHFKLKGQAEVERQVAAENTLC